MNKPIPKYSRHRLPIYLNYIKSLPEIPENEYVSSGNIAAALDLGEVLVRKDLAYTNCKGRPKKGYARQELIAALEDYLRCNKTDFAVIVGVGGLGNALLSYDGFSRYGIEPVAGFDVDESKIGKDVAGKPVYDVSMMEEVIQKSGAGLAILAVPSSAAQSVAEKLQKAGIKGILNFAPVQIKLDGVKIINIDVAANLAVLSSQI